MPSFIRTPADVMVVATARITRLIEYSACRGRAYVPVWGKLEKNNPPRRLGIACSNSIDANPFGEAFVLQVDRNMNNYQAWHVRGSSSLS